MTVTYRCEEIIKGAFLCEVMIQDHSVIVLQRNGILVGRISYHDSGREKAAHKSVECKKVPNLKTKTQHGLRI